MFDVGDCFCGRKLSLFVSFQWRGISKTKCFSSYSRVFFMIFNRGATFYFKDSASFMKGRVATGQRRCRLGGRSGKNEGQPLWGLPDPRWREASATSGTTEKSSIFFHTDLASRAHSYHKLFFSNL